MNDELKKQFPTAKPEFIDCLMEILELHAKKNNDYNGSNYWIQNYNEFETYSKFADVRRKYSRLYHFIVNKTKMKVDEKVEDTAIDLCVYAILFYDYIKRFKK